MAAVEDRFAEQRSRQDIAVANQRVLRRLAIAIKAGNGKLNLLVAVADRAVERDAWIGEYEAILSEKGMRRSYRVKLDSRRPSLKQSLLDFQADGVALKKGEFVSVLGAAELLDLRLEKGERSSLEKLLFSLQWTREALRAFNCPIVLWVSNKVADALATASPDFWSWRGNGLFEFESERRAERVLQPVNLDLQGTVSVLKPRRADDESELGRKAAVQWEELEALLASEPDSPLLASLYRGLGFTERDRGNWDSAETLLKRAIQLHREAGDRTGESYALGCLGDIERKRGNWDEAERIYYTAQKLHEELEDGSGIATSLACLGDIERNRGNWDEAERLYRKSLDLREELGDRSGIAISIGSLGEVEMLRGNLDQAEPLLQQSCEQVSALGDNDKIAEANWDLARLYRTKGNPDLAQTHYATAHRLFTQLGAAKDLERIEKEWPET